MAVSVRGNPWMGMCRVMVVVPRYVDVVDRALPSLIYVDQSFTTIIHIYMNVCIYRPVIFPSCFSFPRSVPDTTPHHYPFPPQPNTSNNPPPTRAHYLPIHPSIPQTTKSTHTYAPTYVRIYAHHPPAHRPQRTQTQKINSIGWHAPSKRRVASQNTYRQNK